MPQYRDTGELLTSSLAPLLTAMAEKKKRKKAVDEQTYNRILDLVSKADSDKRMSVWNTLGGQNYVNPQEGQLDISAILPYLGKSQDEWKREDREYERGQDAEKRSLNRMNAFREQREDSRKAIMELLKIPKEIADLRLTNQRTKTQKALADRYGRIEEKEPPNLRPMTDQQSLSAWLEEDPKNAQMFIDLIKFKEKLVRGNPSEERAITLADTIAKLQLEQEKGSGLRLYNPQDEEDGMSFEEALDKLAKKLGYVK